jgi:hypothetical protein
VTASEIHGHGFSPSLFVCSSAEICRRGFKVFLAQRSCSLLPLAVATRLFPSIDQWLRLFPSVYQWLRLFPSVYQCPGACLGLGCTMFAYAEI